MIVYVVQGEEKINSVWLTEIVGIYESKDKALAKVKEMEKINKYSDYYKYSYYYITTYDTETGGIVNAECVLK